MNRKLHLKKLLIKTKKQVFSEIIGNNTSPLKGEGYDFLELKEYEYGEDAKNIDWMISAKLQKPYVKVFHAQKELNINIVPFLNGSVFFGTKHIKQDIMSEICALIGFSAIKQGDPFASYIANENLIPLTAYSKKMYNVQTMTENLFEYPVMGKKLDFSSSLNQLYKRLKKRSIVFLIGDFMDVSNLDLKLLSTKHEVYVILVRDAFEENPQELGNVNFIDPSDFSNFEGTLNTQSIKNYTQALEKNDHKLYEHLQQCGIRFTKILTHEQPISKMIELLNR